ncbi:MAG: malto-oligosyltrehalose synthase, partial [Chloroflexota bacterium]|nr:malto-oligosyltrehalose synthase [Chloroflexota bacterium]
MPANRRYSPPLASYRLQLRPGFGFDEVRELLPYLSELGISHVYVSPIFAAAPGSTHGYDVLDHNQVNPELGGLPALYRLGEELLARDMGLIVDTVPNHVGIAGGANPWWRDVLRYGRASRFAGHFDIDWEAQPQMSSGVLVYPILGKPFGEALESGELQLVLDGTDLAVRYYEHVLPVSPAAYHEVLGLPPLGSSVRLNDPTAIAQVVELLEVLRTALPEQADLALDRFRLLLGSEPALVAWVEERLTSLNGEVGSPRSFDRLDQMLSVQPYRLAYWRISGEEINYRRFFDINELAAIRVEREDVFEATHRLLLDLVRRGIVTGVRIDHVDGLYDPAGYLQRLRAALDEASSELTQGQVLIVVEKILEEGERLPSTWPVAGTTGYDFISDADGLLVDRQGSKGLTEAYEHFLRSPVWVGSLVYRAKRQITDSSFAGEINVLALQLHRLARRQRRHRDNTLRSLRRALETTLATFPVYRTYVDQDGNDDGAGYISEAIEEARRREPELSPFALDFLEEVLLLEGEGLDADELAQRTRFRRKFQQLSGPVMAKGFEDTALYRYNRLISLNEVGGDPAAFGKSPSEVHASLRRRALKWPHSMLTGSTHDTKRSEDVRARLHLLSELPEVWDQEVRRWSRLNARHRGTLGGNPIPGPNTEYLIYQTLVGSWP